jgi:hypothetical protein
MCTSRTSFERADDRGGLDGDAARPGRLWVPRPCGPATGNVVTSCRRDHDGRRGRSAVPDPVVVSGRVARQRREHPDADATDRGPRRHHDHRPRHPSWQHMEDPAGRLAGGPLRVAITRSTSGAVARRAISGVGHVGEDTSLQPLRGRHQVTVTAYDVGRARVTGTTEIDSHTYCCDEGGVVEVAGVDSDGSVILARSSDRAWIWRPGTRPVRLTGALRSRGIAGNDPWPGGVSWTNGDSSDDPAAFGRVSRSGVVTRGVGCHRARTACGLRTGRRTPTYPSRSLATGDPWCGRTAHASS